MEQRAKHIQLSSRPCWTTEGVSSYMPRSGEATYKEGDDEEVGYRKTHAGNSRLHRKDVRIFLKVKARRIRTHRDLTATQRIRGCSRKAPLRSGTAKIKLKYLERHDIVRILSAARKNIYQQICEDVEARCTKGWEAVWVRVVFGRGAATTHWLDHRGDICKPHQTPGSGPSSSSACQKIRQ